MSHQDNGGTKFSRKGGSVYEALCKTKAHPSAETLYQELKKTYPNLSRTTVYTNLNRMRAEGSVTCVGVVDGAERYDANTAPHPHFFCEKCGAVIDVEGLPELQHLIEAAEAHNAFQVRGYELSFRGLCEKCAAAEREKTTET